MKSKAFWIVVLAMTVFAIFLTLTVRDCRAQATGSVTLLWDASIDEPYLCLEGATDCGYRIYYRKAEEPEIMVPVGIASQYTIQGLSPGVYVFSMTAYDYRGLESIRTPEITWRTTIQPPRNVKAAVPLSGGNK